MTKQQRAPFTADLRKASFAEWLDITFDHPERAEPTKVDHAWYWMHEVALVADPVRQIRYLTQLFRQPEILAQRYTAAQVEEGFWFMLSGGGEEWYRDALWDPEVPWEARAACIATVPVLYERLFAPDEDAGGIPWMLWDLLAFDYDCGNRDPARNEEDRRVQDAMLEAMSRMLLRSKSPMAQRAALHGLFHLNHPKGPGLIRTYLDSRRIPRTLRDYAANVLAGEAL